MKRKHLIVLICAVLAIAMIGGCNDCQQLAQHEQNLEFYMDLSEAADVTIQDLQVALSDPELDSDTAKEIADSLESAKKYKRFVDITVQAALSVYKSASEYCSSLE